MVVQMIQQPEATRKHGALVNLELMGLAIDGFAGWMATTVGYQGIMAEITRGYTSSLGRQASAHYNLY